MSSTDSFMLLYCNHCVWLSSLTLALAQLTAMSCDTCDSLDISSRTSKSKTSIRRQIQVRCQSMEIINSEFLTGITVLNVLTSMDF